MKVQRLPPREFPPVGETRIVHEPRCTNAPCMCLLGNSVVTDGMWPIADLTLEDFQKLYPRAGERKADQ